MSPTDELLAELCPNGMIRAAVNVANAVLAHVDKVTGTFGGRSVDVATRLAAKVGRSLSIVAYESAASIVAATDRDEWDIAFIAEDPARADRFLVSTPYTCRTILGSEWSQTSTERDAE